LNQLIDRGVAQPEDVNDEVWKALKEKRETEESKKKSEQMATIAKARIAKKSNRKALHEAILVRLVCSICSKQD